MQFQLNFFTFSGLIISDLIPSFAQILLQLLPVVRPVAEPNFSFPLILESL
jgi:hypothetical protein